MQKQPLFSVLIANYNNGKYLIDAIESVRKQTYTNWEIILVDDASTDNSHELYKNLEQDKRIHIYYNEQNKGCGFTKRRCAELASGEFGGYLDPDDALVDCAIEVMVGKFKQDEKLSLVYSRLYVTDNELNINYIASWQHKIPHDMSFLEYGKCAISQFAAFNIKMYSKTVGIRADAKRAVDYNLYYLLEEVGQILFIPDILYLYRINTGNNISTQGCNPEKAKMWELLLMEDACIRRGLDIESIVHKRFLEYVDSVKYESYAKGQQNIKESIYYRVGYFFLIPLKMFKKIFIK